VEKERAAEQPDAADGARPDGAPPLIWVLNETAPR
jgi:hypothetical protein